MQFPITHIRARGFQLSGPRSNFLKFIPHPSSFIPFLHPFLSSFILSLVLVSALAGCSRQPAGTSRATPNAEPRRVIAPDARNPGRLIHVVVALCDNQYQGIVPVPAKIGNGDDPANNLYWGAGYGVRTHFKRSPEWTLVAEIANPNQFVLQRLVFKHRTKAAFLVADGYRGREIRQATTDFLTFAAGGDIEPIEVTVGQKKITLYGGGGADLVAYVGHDGLMDFTLPEYPSKADDRERDAVILACISKRFFADPLRKTGARPLLWTTGLMAPEAYVLEAAVQGWLAEEPGDAVRRRAATAYNRYQKCGSKAALNLFATGWGAGER